MLRRKRERESHGARGRGKRTRSGEAVDAAEQAMRVKAMLAPMVKRPRTNADGVGSRRVAPVLPLGTGRTRGLANAPSAKRRKLLMGSTLPSQSSAPVPRHSPYRVGAVASADPVTSEARASVHGPQQVRLRQDPPVTKADAAPAAYYSDSEHSMLQFMLGAGVLATDDNSDAASAAAGTDSATIGTDDVSETVSVADAVVSAPVWGRRVVYRRDAADGHVHDEADGDDQADAAAGDEDEDDDVGVIDYPSSPRSPGDDDGNDDEHAGRDSDDDDSDDGGGDGISDKGMQRDRSLSPGRLLREYLAHTTGRTRFPVPGAGSGDGTDDDAGRGGSTSSPMRLDRLRQYLAMLRRRRMQSALGTDTDDSEGRVFFRSTLDDVEDDEDENDDDDDGDDDSVNSNDDDDDDDDDSDNSDDGDRADVRRQLQDDQASGNGSSAVRDALLREALARRHHRHTARGSRITGVQRIGEARVRQTISRFGRLPMICAPSRVSNEVRRVVRRVLASEQGSVLPEARSSVVEIHLPEDSVMF